MPEWTDREAIKQAVFQKWGKGHLLRHALLGDDLFPMRIALKQPTAQEMGAHFAQMIEWIKQLKQHDKAALGYGYHLVEKEVHYRVYGKNVIPTHAQIDTLSDAVRLIGKQDELSLFEQNAAALLQQWGCLREWIAKYPFQVIALGQKCDAVLRVLHWFSQHEVRNLYLRQLDIAGVDTKFIETNKAMLTQLLDFVLPTAQIEGSATIFEQRYGLRRKPSLLRFRILDQKLSWRGCTDISLPIEQFARLELPVQRCFFTENEINFLCFPYQPNACVIFGKGYGAELFRVVPWLREKQVYYWGDIDTHGFNILSMVRRFLPQTKSFLMTEEILLSHRAMWSLEKKPFTARIEELTPEEFELACKLQTNAWGNGVRLEQERVRFTIVEDFLAALPQVQSHIQS